MIADFNAGKSGNVSEHAVESTLLDIRVCCCRPTKVLFFIERHRRLRLQWRRKFRHWTPAQWKYVAWLSESQFFLHHTDGTVTILWLAKEQLLDQCMLGAIKGARLLIRLWRALGYAVVTNNTIKSVV